MYGTMFDLYGKRLAKGGDDILLDAAGEEITTARFHRSVIETAGWLRAQGIGKGDVVAVWMLNRVEWLALLFALSRIGATLAAVNTRYKSGEIFHILNKSKARLLIMEERFRNIDFMEIAGEVDFQALPALTRIAVFNPTTTSHSLGHAQIVEFSPGPADAEAGLEDTSDPDVPVILFVTSGTTKMPKLVAHCARSLGYNASKVAPRQAYDEDSRLLAALPLCGIFCLMGVLITVVSGGKIVVMETFDGAEAARLIMEKKITHLYGSDDLYLQTVEHMPAGFEMSFARHYGIASFSRSLAAIGPDLVARGFPVYGLYGSSEVLGYVFSSTAHSDPKFRFDGGGARSAGDEFEIRIRDLATNEILPPGRSGSLEIRSPSCFVGYFNDPDETAKAFTEDGFYRTGDLAHVREDGSLAYESRIGDAVRIAGYLVNPAEIEDVLMSFDGIEVAQVVNIKQGDEERLVAYIKSADNSDITEETIVDRLKRELSSFKIPSFIWKVDEFPIADGTNGAKIRKGDLRKDALARLSRSV